jgi:hypothetical protein
LRSIGAEKPRDDEPHFEYFKSRTGYGEMKEEHDMGNKYALCLATTVLKPPLLEFGSSCVKRAKFQETARNINI